MLGWRITKYNPEYRDSRGAYLKDEWTQYSDIGKIFEGKMVTFEDYVKVEDSYVSAIVSFMEYLDIKKLAIADFTRRNTGLKKNIHNTLLMIDFYYTLKNKQYVTKEFVPTVTRLILREILWCKFETKSMYVHFGWDYYMYIGSKKRCKDTLIAIEKSDLFVEPYESPHMKEIEEV